MCSCVCPLKRQLSLACWRNTYLWRHSTNNCLTMSNRSSEEAKNRVQNIECSFDCVARSAVLLKRNVTNILLNFCEQKFVQHGPITIAIDVNGLFLLDKNPHQTVTRFACVGFVMYACGFFVPQMLQFCLFTYPPRSKWASSEKTIFFCRNRHLLSIAGPLIEAYTSLYTLIFVRRKDKINYMWNQT